MKKNTKLLIGITAGVCVLGAALAVVLALPSKDVKIDVQDNNAILLLDKQTLVADEITVKNSGGEYKLLGYDYDNQIPSAAKSSEPSEESQNSGESSIKTAADDVETVEVREIYTVYSMKDYEDEELYKPYTDELCRECCYITATALVDKSGNRYEEYGLDKPVSEVSVVFSDGSKTKLSLGNYAPENKGVYLKMSGDKNVYLVLNQSVEMFFVERLQMFDHVLTESIDSGDSVKEIDISGTNYQNDYSFLLNELKINKTQYILSSPYRLSADDEQLDIFAKAIYGMIGTNVVQVAAGKDDLAKYGLDKPYQKVTITTLAGVTTTVLAGKPDKDGNFYLMNSEKTTIFSMNKDDVTWYGVNTDTLVKDNVIYDDLSNITNLTTYAMEMTDDYVFESETSLSENYTETKYTVLKYHGKEILFDNFFIFYQNLEALTVQSPVPDSIDGCEEIFRFELTYDIESDNEELKKDNKEIVSFYRNKDGGTICTLNGNIRGYVDSEYADKLIAQTNQIHYDKTIERLELPEASEQ